MFKEGDDVRDAGLTTPDDVERFNDIAYGPESGYWQLLDVYRPKGAEGPLPVIVSVHGGAWVYGDKDRYQWYCMSLAQRGFAVVNFTYRLAPEFQFPASIEDTDAVFRWVLDHADDYGFDGKNVFAVGDSAGAHMLALYTCLCIDAEHAARIGVVPPEGFVPTAIALNCGSFRLKKTEKTGDPLLDMLSGIMEDLLPQGGTQEEFEAIAPILHVNEGFPPTFLMTAEDDFLKSDALPMAQELMACNVETCLHFYRSEANKLGHVFHCNMRLPEAAWCNDDECAFFRAHLR
jgi:acetyl esterase/lipase